jgi:hypothetical protein
MRLLLPLLLLTSTEPVLVLLLLPLLLLLELVLPLLHLLKLPVLLLLLLVLLLALLLLVPLLLLLLSLHSVAQPHGSELLHGLKLSARSSSHACCRSPTLLACTSSLPDELLHW